MLYRVEEGLINDQSPFCGSKKFGLNHVNNDGTVCQVGVLLRIEGHKLLGDGRMIIVNRGAPREDLHLPSLLAIVE